MKFIALPIHSSIHSFIHSFIHHQHVKWGVGRGEARGRDKAQRLPGLQNLGFIWRALESHVKVLSRGVTGSDLHLEDSSDRAQRRSRGVWTTAGRSASIPVRDVVVLRQMVVSGDGESGFFSSFLINFIFQSSFRN